MFPLAFLPSFISLFSFDTLCVCEDYFWQSGDILDYYSNSSEVLKSLWLKQIQLEIYTNALKMEDKRSRRANILVLCSTDDIPENFTFLEVPGDITFLFQQNSAMNFQGRLRLDSKVFTYERTNFGFSITELYQIKGGSLIKNLFGTWSPSHEFSDANVNMWERRGDTVTQVRQSGSQA